jgi:hypothetical protein
LFKIFWQLGGKKSELLSGSYCALFKSNGEEKRRRGGGRRRGRGGGGEEEISIHIKREQVK